MNAKMIRLMVIPALALLFLLTPARARGPGQGGNSGCDGAALIADLPQETVDAGEQTVLVYMREEEKLARDVYRAMDDLWGLRVFRNIGRAEQTHMDVLLTLLKKYGIPDPVGDNGFGEFTDPDLQALYNDLITQGSTSLNGALVVGATVEDLDIRDLQIDLLQVDNEDIATAFQNLQKGSRNHLRSFVGLLEANGVRYVPQFISPEDFDAIIESPRERGVVDADGEPVSSAGCPSGGSRQRHSHTSRHR